MQKAASVLRITLDYYLLTGTTALKPPHTLHSARPIKAGSASRCTEHSMHKPCSRQGRQTPQTLKGAALLTSHQQEDLWLSEAKRAAAQKTPASAWVKGGNLFAARPAAPVELGTIPCTWQHVFLATMDSASQHGTLHCRALQLGRPRDVQRKGGIQLAARPAFWWKWKVHALSSAFSDKHRL